ncbi:MAG: ABC transporter permease [Oscillospiraceae bacterium]|nr:ABC transporter permease [Oscillospiraceae bacterium]
MTRTKKTYTFLVFAFLYAPIVVFIFYSFNQSKSRSNFTGFSLRWYIELMQNDRIISALQNTLVVAVLSALAATLLGTAASLGITALKKAPRALIMNITYLPILNPEIVTGISLMLLFVAAGTFLGISLGFWSVLIAHITFNIPYVILNVMPKIRQTDKNIIDAAMDLGCSAPQAFFKVMLPEITPGIASGALMAFTLSFDNFVISYFTLGSDGFTTLPVNIYTSTRRGLSLEYNALFAILFVTVLIFLILMGIADNKAASKNPNSAKQIRLRN